MTNDNFKILLADDDADDRMFFQDVLEELAIKATLTMVCNGLELMSHLLTTIHLPPNVLFLDLNMPSKSGAECLTEIKSHEALCQIPIIIYSTSANPDVIELTYMKGAQYYIRKEGDFSRLKTVIGRALALCQQESNNQPQRNNFFIQL